MIITANSGYDGASDKRDSFRKVSCIAVSEDCEETTCKIGSGWGRDGNSYHCPTPELARRTIITAIMNMMVVSDKRDSFRSVSCVAVPKKIKKIARKGARW